MKSLATSACVRLRSSRASHWLRRGIVVAVGIGMGLAAWIWVQERPLRAIRAAEANQEWSAAMNLAVQYLRSHPEDNEVLRTAARCLSRLGSFAEAESFFERASDLTDVDLRLEAAALKGLGRNASAAMVLERILDLEPNDPQALRQLALVKHAIGRTDEAIQLAQRLGGDNDYMVVALLMEAVFWDDLLRGEQAVDCLERALSIEPTGDNVGPLPRDRVYVLLGRNLLRLGRSREARDAMNRAIEKREAPASCWYLGQAELQCGDEEQAERWWKHALLLEPHYSQALSSLGQLALRADNSAEAVRWLSRAIEHGEESVAVHSSLARAYARLGKEDLMHEHQERAEDLRRQQEQERLEGLMIRQRPGSPEARRILAERAKREGRFLEAQDMMNVFEPVPE